MPISPETKNGVRQLLVFHQIVSQNTGGKLVLYTKEIPRWSTYNMNDWTTWDWDNDYRLETYDTLAALKPHISASLYEEVARALSAEEAEAKGDKGQELREN